MSKKEDDFYRKLKLSLIDTTVFPSDYMYKFIIPNKENLKEQLEKLFDFEGAVIKYKPSKTGKFISFTALCKVKNADEVIKKYKDVSKVEGVISL